MSSNGCSSGTGTDVAAVETADIVLMRSDPRVAVAVSTRLRERVDHLSEALVQVQPIEYRGPASAQAVDP